MASRTSFSGRVDSIHSRASFSLTKTRLYISLNGKFISPISNGYYNLATNRIISEPNRRTGFLVSEKYRITGTKDHITRFAYLNNIPLDEIIAINLQENFFTRLIRCFSAPTIKVDLNKVSSQTNVKKIDFDSIAEFSLLGLKGICKTLYVYDGDTFNLGIVLPLDFLRQVQPRRISNMYINQAVAHVSDSNVTTALKIRCRFAGIDAVEMGTSGGPKAKEILESIFNKYNNILRYICLGTDKYGRYLVRLYTDEDMREDLAHYLVRTYPSYFSHYYGGKKDTES